MSYLVPVSSVGTMLWNNEGSGSSAVDRINTIASPNTANGIGTTIGETWANPGGAHFKLGTPAVGVDETAEVAIEAYVGALFGFGTGDVQFNFTLREGSESGSVIASGNGTRTPDTPITYGLVSLVLTAPQVAAVGNWNDLYLSVDVTDIATGERHPRVAELGLRYTESSGGATDSDDFLLMGAG
jgi:hypothetical protein